MLAKATIFLFVVHFVITSRITFLGRYSCNVISKKYSCEKDTYIAQAFYFGLLDGGAIHSNGTFKNSDTRIEFYDLTVEGKLDKKLFADSEPTGYYTSTSLDLLLNNKNDDPIIGLVGFESDCVEVSALAQAYDIFTIIDVGFERTIAERCSRAKSIQ